MLVIGFHIIHICILFLLHIYFFKTSGAVKVIYFVYCALLENSIYLEI